MTCRTELRNTAFFPHTVREWYELNQDVVLTATLTPSPRRYQAHAKPYPLPLFFSHSLITPLVMNKLSVGVDGRKKKKKKMESSVQVLLGLLSIHSELI
ncbi:hypothetical protein BaRGS_00011021 [Batillaria attramentaria]|uniref:Uncharacterized protein n=1 Tax=Batillaria attramentaria TaxID=370345 RepID=A0ABD0LEN3_9CAEN